jgi:hypothetical protein
VNDANGAERTAQLEKAVLLSLELLERGDADAAREELARVAPAAAPEPLASAISEQELDAAFADAAADVDQMLDADGVAAAAIRATDLDHPDDDLLPVAADDAPVAHEVSAQFATATMAELLAQQGDETSASQIRASLEPAHTATETSEASSPRSPRDGIVRTLETWLQNLRGGTRA